MSEHTAENDAPREPCRTNPHKAHGDCPGSTRAQHGAKLLAQLRAINARVIPPAVPEGGRDDG